MEANGKPVIRVEDVTIAFGDDVILEDINFEVNQGEIFIILGGSGCGKSTLIKHMISLHAPAKGRVLIDGKDVAVAKGAELNEILREIGVMYQHGVQKIILRKEE